MSEQPFPAEGPDDPAYTEESGTEQSGTEESSQVSEVQHLDQDESDTPVSPSDSTAGYPESESGDPDTRGSGPSEAPPENRRDNDV